MKSTLSPQITSVDVVVRKGSGDVPYLLLGQSYLFFNDLENWERFVRDVTLFESARLAELPEEVIAPECDRCVELQYLISGGNIERVEDGRYLCEDHREAEAAETAERQADEWLDQHEEDRY